MYLLEAFKIKHLECMITALKEHSNNGSFNLESAVRFDFIVQDIDVHSEF